MKTYFELKEQIAASASQLNEIVTGYDPSVSGKEDSKITSKVRAHTKDSEASHIGTTSDGDHVYAHGDQDDGEKNHYAVHHKATGKITTHTIKHGGNPTSERELSKPSKIHDVHKLHHKIRNIIHGHLKDNVDDYWD